MSSRRYGGLAALALLAAIPPLTAPPAQAGGFGLFGKKREEPKPPVILLAERIDEIEESLNETGTIVAKKPDVWGESRMTKHRQEVEIELAKRIDKFELLLNASVSRSDAAFFANTFALQAALGGGDFPDLPSPADPTAASSFIIQNPAGDAENSDVLVRTTPGAMQIATRTGEAADGALGFATTGIGLEPTIQLDQLKRYLDHLNELRRLNEGGDTADAPGYALNLVRIPVSVLPGGETRIGHGAEITVTAETHLTPELLPTAFRTLVIQDLVDQLALPVLKIAEAKPWETPADLERARALEEAQSHLVQARKLTEDLATNADFVRNGGVTSLAAIEALLNLAIRIQNHLTQAAALSPETNAGVLTHQFDDLVAKLTSARAIAAGAQQEREKARRLTDLAADYARLSKALTEREAKKQAADEARAREKRAAEEEEQAPDGSPAEEVNPPAGADGRQGPAINAQPVDPDGEAQPPAAAPAKAVRRATADRVAADAAAEKATDRVQRLASELQADEAALMRMMGLEAADAVPDTADNAREQADERGRQAAESARVADQKARESQGVAQQALEHSRDDISNLMPAIESAVEGLGMLIQGIGTEIGRVQGLLAGTVATLPTASSSPRVSRYAVPPSRIIEVFGEKELVQIARDLDRFRERECSGRVIHLSDARAFLGEELQAAYDFLLSPTGSGFWDCAASLAPTIRGGEPIVEARFAVTCGGMTTVRSLAWAVLVEAALLNERLNEDMRRVSGDPECNCMYGGPHVFLGPDPPADARYAFMEYVRCRWPIQVFALDPVNQNQNIADELSLRRELQLSAAVALASGSISASDAMRFTRQIALDQETIALNTTAAAFAHGANTFGWRFYPRFQTADIESNTTVLFRDLLVGGPRRDHLIRDYRIEPGMRECVALVVMPSFVPHVRFDIRSSWFELTDPEDTEASMTETVEMSRKIRDMQRLAEICTVEADSYRPGETERLLARVKQLSDKMPLQTVYAQVPYENTAGGFELFSSGVTDLGPELIDFYGAPGVGKARDTVLFLVGKNFSVHETQVIAGNKCCDFDLLSRDVMKVTIPKDFRTVVCRRQTSSADDPCLECRPTGKCGPDCYEAVEVHLATPYGVSGRLLIPVYPGELSPEGATAAAAAEAAAAAANAAVAGHEAVFHPIRFGWMVEEAEGYLCFDAARNVTNFCIHDDAIVIKRAGSTPFGVPARAEFAGFVEAVFADGTTQRFGTAFGAMSLPFNARGEAALNRDCAPLSIQSEPNLLVAQILPVLQSQANLAFHATALNIHGYVRHANCPPDCERPVRMTNTLTIKLGPCRTDKCVLPGACPTCLTQIDGQRVTAPPLPAPAKDAGLSPPATTLERAVAEDATFEVPLPPLAEGLVEEAFTDRGFTALPGTTERSFPSAIEPVLAGPALVAEPTGIVPVPPAAVSPAAAPSGLVVPVVPVAPAIGGIFPGPAIATPLPPTLAIGTAPPVMPPPVVVLPSQAAPQQRHGLFNRLFRHGDGR